MLSAIIECIEIRYYIYKHVSLPANQIMDQVARQQHLSRNPTWASLRSGVAGVASPAEGAMKIPEFPSEKWWSVHITFVYWTRKLRPNSKASRIDSYYFSFEQLCWNIPCKNVGFTDLVYSFCYYLLYMRTIKSMSFTKHADERIVRIHVGGGMHLGIWCAACSFSKSP